VNSGAALEILEARARDLPVLLSMMRRLAEHPPAIPFADDEVRAALERFLDDAELGKAWLVWVGGRPAGT
jgi:hypothetical protein